MNQLPPPKPLSFGGNASENYKAFKQCFEIYMIAAGLSDKKDESIKANILLHLLGEEALAVYNGFIWEADEDKLKTVEIFKKFENYCTPRTNVALERHKFYSRVQHVQESFDSFFIAICTQASSCEFSTLKDEMLRDRIVCGIRADPVRLRLLRTDGLTLTKCVQICRAAEATEHQSVQLHPGAAAQAQAAIVANVNQVRSSPWRGKGKGPEPHQQSNRQFAPRQNPHKSAPRQNQNAPRQQGNKCGYCAGNSHQRRFCPASNAYCNNCKKKGHFKAVCRSSAVHHVQSEDTLHDPSARVSDQDYDMQYMYNPNVSDSDNYLFSLSAGHTADWCVDADVNGSLIKFRVDSGADVTVISKPMYDSAFSHIPLRPAGRVLRGPDNKPLHCLGCFPATITRSGLSLKEDIYVLIQGSSLLSRDASRNLKVITFVGSVSEFDVGKEFPALFTGLGKLAEPYKIRLDESIQPYSVSHTRRVPLPLMPKVKLELDRLEMLGVIRPVSKPTEWCAPMVVVPKSSGQVRICVDLTKLNRAVKRERLMLPSVDHTLGQLAGAAIFSKLDANSGFHQVVLEDNSQLLTTFITPFGRYAYQRLPFGINSGPEHFQRQVMRILENLPGAVCLMDDIVIFGSDQAEHDQRLRDVLQRLSSAGITLNKDKCEFCKTEVSFLGQTLSSQGIKADPEKIAAITELTEPQDIHELRRFMGMVNQLGKFLPNLADITEPMRVLLCVKNDWLWGPPQDSAFKKTKQLLCTSPVLALYNPTSETKITADSSSYGLGAAITQKASDGTWRPVAYASRALTPTEGRYAQVEKEALASTWACEKFQDYVIGMKFLLETDHLPLISLLGSKSLDELPPRIQRFRMRLMRYNYDIAHVPGKELYTADMLSRAPRATPAASDIAFEQEVTSFVNHVLQSIPVTDCRLEEIRTHQQEDVVCRQLMCYCEEGWPERHMIKGALQPYWPLKSEITCQDGLVLFGCRLVIPASLQLEILDRVHEGHQGIVKCRQRARQAIWWPGMSKQIGDLVANCRVCCKNSTPPPEPLIPTVRPERPWMKVATDLFDFRQTTYLLVVDYMSRYIEIAQLGKTTSAEVIKQLKNIFARHGIPEVVVSDNGPQYASQEFLMFASSYGFTHVTSSPGHASGNGEAERGVRTIKDMLTSSNDPYTALLNYRAAPLANGFSPAELLMNRRLRTKLPSVPSNLVTKAPDAAQVKEREARQMLQQKINFDHRHRAKPLSPISEGDEVWIRDRKQYGLVKSQVSPRSYNVETDTGIYRRNRVQFNKMPVASMAKSAVPYNVDNALPSMAKTAVPNKSDGAQPSTGSSTPRSPTVLPAPQLATSGVIKHDSGSTAPTTTTRSGRLVKVPARFKD